MIFLVLISLNMCFGAIKKRLIRTSSWRSTLLSLSSATETVILLRNKKNFLITHLFVDTLYVKMMCKL